MKHISHVSSHIEREFAQKPPKVIPIGPFVMEIKSFLKNFLALNILR
jgi:hypothetical protein